MASISYAEFTQALILHSTNPPKADILIPKNFQTLIDDLKSLSHAINFRDYDPSLLDESEEVKAQRSLIKVVQAHTQIEGLQEKFYRLTNQ